MLVQWLTVHSVEGVVPPSVHPVEHHLLALVHRYVLVYRISEQLLRFFHLFNLRHGY